MAAGTRGDASGGDLEFCGEPLEDRYWNPDTLGIHADPIESDAGLRSFFVGTDAAIRNSLNRPADDSSQPQRNPPQPG